MDTHQKDDHKQNSELPEEIIAQAAELEKKLDNLEERVSTDIDLTKKFIKTTDE